MSTFMNVKRKAEVRKICDRRQAYLHDEFIGPELRATTNYPLTPIHFLEFSSLHRGRKTATLDSDTRAATGRNA